MGMGWQVGRASRATLVMTSVAISTACATAPGRKNVGHTRPASHSSSEVVTSEELSTLGVQTLYDAIQRLRPEYFRTSPPTFASPRGTLTVVYINGVRMGGMDAMRSITSGSVHEVRYLRPGQAQLQYREYIGASIIDVTLEGR
jgi:hypothetical protein